MRSVACLGLLLVAACGNDAAPSLASGGAPGGGAAGLATAGTAGAAGAGGTTVVAGGSSGSSGSGGVAGSGGAGGSGGGGQAGSGGLAGAGSGGGGSGPGPAAPLSGLTLQVECGAPGNQMRSCSYLPPADANCGGGQLRTYAETMVTMGGSPGTVYDVTLRVRGIVEANEYVGGTSDNNGFYVGGQVGGHGGPQYSQYSLEVSAPAAVYRLNQLDPGAQQDMYKNPENGGVVHHFGFIIDYLATIAIEGGATVQMRGQDNDCFMGRNCEPPSDDFGQCTAQKLPGLSEAQVPQGDGFDGNFIWIDAESAVVRH